MHETTVRFADELWSHVQQRCRREGISAAQFVRDATLARVAIEQHLTSLRVDVDVALGEFEGRVERLEELLRRHGLH